MFKLLLVALLPSLFLFNSFDSSPVASGSSDRPSGTLEKLSVASGSVTMTLDSSLGDRSRGAKPNSLHFEAGADEFFNVLVFNGEFRGPLPGMMNILPLDSPTLPTKLQASYQRLVVESTSIGSKYELVVRDRETGFVFFNIEGTEYSYDPEKRTMTMTGGRLLLSESFASSIGRPKQSGMKVGDISVDVTMRPLQVTELIDGEITSEKLPPTLSPEAGSVPGPDVIVGDLNGLAQFGAQSGTQVGLAVGTDSCNFGTENLNWFANPANDHPVIPQNMYRMSGGPTNDERFEQIGQSSVKHAFTALTNDICGLGCNGVGGTRLGSGCSDPYSAGLNAGTNNALGSRAWINPFTGAYPRNDGGSTNNSHAGHTHTGPTHRILIEVNDLIPSLNPGATYYAEGQYITPHEYVWCQANPTQCNMYNNVSYRRYNVTNSASPFSFSPPATTVRQKAAISAWSGSTPVEIKPAPGVDGVAILAYKVTNPSPGVWHYEYAIYNQNLDRAIQSFSIPTGYSTLSNIGFHAPPQHPASANDGTFNSAGFSSSAWAQTPTPGNFTWSSETFAQNQNANAIRWGTLYNFRFDSNSPPTLANATIGFLKTGSPITVQIQVPSLVNVSVSGYVRNSSGRGVTNAEVTFQPTAGGTVRTAITNRLGFYRFDNVTPGAMYTVGATAHRWTFTSQQINVTDNVTNANFIPN